MGMPKSDRLFFILNLLRARRNLNAILLARECGVTERSIYRDIISLSEANVPIYYDRGYKLASDNFLPPLNFTFEEYSCLKLALESSPLNRTGKHRPTLKRIKAKVDANISRQVKEQRKTAVDTTHIDIAVSQARVSQARKKGERFYSRIEEAIENNQCLQVRYESINSGLTTRVVEPYFIIFRGRAFYFVAYCRLRKELRTFRVDRIENVKLIDEHFVRRKGVNARDYFEGSWEVFSGEPVEVTVKFTQTAARVILSGKYHPKEEVEKLGEDEVVYRVTVRGLEEIKRWILGFGDEAEVLSPAELRESIRGITQSLSEKYGSPGDR
jgi:predicted DNA-binding transcriptional regulator YafY